MRVKIDEIGLLFDPISPFSFICVAICSNVADVIVIWCKKYFPLFLTFFTVKYAKILVTISLPGGERSWKMF